MEINRIYATANKCTFQIKAIRSFVTKYLKSGMVSVDPFARDCNLGTYTNDINPGTSAQYHEDVLFFLIRMREMRVQADCAIWDPPYSAEAAKREYGRKLDMGDIYRWRRWTAERNLLNEIMKEGGVVLSFGWDSSGMGKIRGYEQIEILLVNHGQAKNDTICLAERKRSNPNNHCR